MRHLFLTGIGTAGIFAASMVPQAGAPTCALTTRPAVVPYGIPLDLSWTTTDASRLTISGGIGAVGPVERGTVRTTPSASGIYTAIVEGPGGTATCSIAVTIAYGAALTPEQYRQYGPGAQAPPPYPPPYPSPPVPIGPLPPPSTTRVPLVLEVNSAGRVLIRGIVSGEGAQDAEIRSWGGTWTIRSNTFGPTTVIPAGPGGISDLSRLRVGDQIGVLGTVSGVYPQTVDAYYVRDWTTNPGRAGDP